MASTTGTSAAPPSSPASGGPAAGKPRARPQPSPNYWQRTAAASAPQQIAREPRAWQRVILAEFLACQAMIAGTMILAPVQGAAQGAGTAARSFSREIVQQTAVCLVFFILALAAGGERTGKVAAAFGGLVTLAIAWHLSELWPALAAALGPAPAKTAAP